MARETLTIAVDASAVAEDLAEHRRYWLEQLALLEPVLRRKVARRLLRIVRDGKSYQLHTVPTGATGPAGEVRVRAFLTFDHVQMFAAALAAAKGDRSHGSSPGLVE